MTILALMALCFGCSEREPTKFEICMRTEVPRAEAATELAAMESIVQRLSVESASTMLFVSQGLPNDLEPNEGVEKKSASIGEERYWPDKNRDYLGWRNFYEHHQRAQRDVEYETWQAAGTWEDRYEKLRARLDDLLRPRALREKCWGDEDCKDPLFLEWDYLGGPSAKWDYYTVLKRALSESHGWSAARVERLRSTSLESAALACNANGIYEGM